MIYRELLPRDSLRRWVEVYWILVDPSPGATRPEKVLPDGRPEILFDFGAPYRWVGCEPTAPVARLVGQIERYIELVPTGPVALLGVRLQPAASYGLFGVEARELTGRSMSLEELELFDLARLQDRMHELPSWAARIELLEHALERRALDRAPYRVSELAAEAMRKDGGRRDVAHVARALGTSLRTLERRFAREVGLSPKLYSRQMRLQRALAMIEDGRAPSWSDVANRAGCFDQAHLVREFRHFAGEPPEKYLRAGHELSGHLTGRSRG